MRQSQLFGKTLRESPKDEVSVNAQLLERGGFVYKTMAGVYDYLPLGWRVLNKINQVIREEMNAIGGQELLLSAMQPRERWEKTGRWQTLGEEVMYQFKDRSDRELGLAPTHEEALAEIALRTISSYKDLPLYVYQIQTKFRSELRAKSGLMRGREFVMKDLYSFHTDKKDLDRYYQIVDQAYRQIFGRLGLEVYVTEASGGSFTKEYTHEYQVLSEAGEDIIFYCDRHIGGCGYSQNKEVSQMQDGGQCPKCQKEIKSGKSIEVGNIFKLGTKFSEAVGLNYTDREGQKHPVIMGSYGIGPGRVLGSIVEVSHDEKGIIWPEQVAPFKIHLLGLKPRNDVASEVKDQSEKLYEKLLANGIEVLYDDRDDKTPGEKFADADLLGIPWRAIISENTIKKKGIGLKKRNEDNEKIISFEEILKIQ